MNKSSKAYKRKRRIKAALVGLLFNSTNNKNLTFGAFGEKATNKE